MWQLAKQIRILIGLRKNFASEMRKKLNSSELFSLRNFFARTLCKMSLRMPVTYFARTLSHFAVFFLTGNWPLDVRVGLTNVQSWLEVSCYVTLLTRSSLQSS